MSEGPGLIARVDDSSSATSLFCDRSMGEAAGGCAVEIPSGGSSEPGKLSFNESRQWFLERMAPNSAAYAVCAATRFVGPLDVAAFRNALPAVVDRQEILRTRYFETDGEPLREVAHRRKAEMEEFDVSGPPADRWREDVRRLALEARATPLDFEHGPLCRFVLYRRSATDNVFLTIFNHIISDAWSGRVFLRDLGDAYSAAVGGRAPDWIDLTVQYADFAASQRGQFTPMAEEPLVNYWCGQLEGAPRATELVTDLRRPAAVDCHAGCVEDRMPDEVVAGLKKLAEGEGATPFIALIATYSVLLNLYTGQSDVVFGTPVAGRNSKGLSDLIGFFVNTLPLRVRLDGDPTFRQLLANAKEVWLGALDHQSLPFERLLQALGPERDLSRFPVFQTMLTLDDSSGPTPSFDALRLESFELDPMVVHSDLSLVIRPDGDTWHNQLLYRTDLFEAATARRFLRHFARLAERVVLDADLPLSMISLVDDEENRLAVEEWSGIKTDYPRNSCVHTLFEELADSSPEAVAVVLGSASLSYRELNERANRLAHYLQELGVGPEGVVGLFGERAIDSIVAILAVFKTGGAYLPIDPEAPIPRIEFLLADGGARVVLVHGSDQVDLVPEGVTAVDLTDAGKFSSLGCDNPGTPVVADNLAYILYTSGSTGNPKGVEVEHRQIIREVRGCDYFDYPSDRVFANLAPLWFDVSCIEIWGALLSGASCVIYPERLPSVAGLRGFFEEHGVTTTHIIASLLNVLLDESPESLRGIKEMFSGGEALDPVHIDKALKNLPDTTKVFNAYGPTECATIATCYEIPREDWGERRAVPIGRPVANTTVYILDHRGRICPPGVPGELHIGGDGVARGYLGDPVLTADRFVPDPFSDRRDARLYRTGDRCRYLENGLVDFLGRTDDQVKVRGFRIELGEVESLLRQIHGVKETVVVARQRPGAGNYLVGYVVPAVDDACGVSELKEQATAALPNHMVPEQFVLLDRLPVTSSGKIDRRHLPDAPEVPAAVGLEGPHSAAEATLLQIWRDVLGRPDIGVQDDFFESGGHSLLALQVMARVQQATGKQLPISALYETRTVAAQAERLGRSEWRPRWTSLTPIHARGTRPPLFLVPPAGGTVLRFAKLIGGLGPDQPVYALEPLGMDGHTEPHTTVEDMAQHYIAELRTVRPQGPYLLGGICFGAHVAFEMAQRLKAVGEDVPLLVLFDPGAPASGPKWDPDPPPRWRFARGLARHLRRRDLGRAIVRRFTKPKVSEWARHVHDQHLVARQAYRARRYNGRIAFFQSELRFQHPRHRIQLERWRELADCQFETAAFTGLTHEELLRGESPQMAEKLAEVLREVPRGGTPNRMNPCQAQVTLDE